jgi:hypothetical protein
VKAILTTAALLALVTTAQAFQLSCIRQGQVQSTIAVDVDLAAKKITIEGVNTLILNMDGRL